LKVALKNEEEIVFQKFGRGITKATQNLQKPGVQYRENACIAKQSIERLDDLQIF